MPPEELVEVAKERAFWVSLLRILPPLHRSRKEVKNEVRGIYTTAIWVIGGSLLGNNMIKTNEGAIFV